MTVEVAADPGLEPPFPDAAKPRDTSGAASGGAFTSTAG